MEASTTPKFAPDPEKQWWVLRVSYGRIHRAHDMLDKKGVEYYLPMRYVVRKVQGKSKRVLTPMIPGLLFVYATDKVIESIISYTSLTHTITYYYDHFSETPQGTNPPLTIDYKSMMNFIAITSIDNKHISLLNPSQYRYRVGEMVRIIDGEFKGIEGRVTRVSNQRCVVVELAGICMIATAYIPTAFTEPINEPQQK
jgi:transcription antitermination factor NusG